MSNQDRVLSFASDEFSTSSISTQSSKNIARLPSARSQASSYASTISAPASSHASCISAPASSHASAISAPASSHASTIRSLPSNNNQASRLSNNQFSLLSNNQSSLYAADFSEPEIETLKSRENGAVASNNRVPSNNGNAASNTPIKGPHLADASSEEILRQSTVIIHPSYSDFRFTGSEAVIVKEIGQKQDEVSAKVQELHEKIRVRDERIKKLEKDRKILTGEYERQVQSLESNLRDSEHSIINLKTTHRNMANDYESILQENNAKLLAAEEQYETLKNTTNQVLGDLNNQVEALETKLKQRDEECKALEARLKQRNEEHKSLETSHHDIVRSLESETKVLMSHVNELEDMNVANIDEIEALREKLAKYEAKEQEEIALKEKLQMAERRIEEERVAKAGAEAILKISAESMQELQAQKSSLEARVLELERVIVEHDKALEELQQFQKTTAGELKGAKAALLDACKRLEIALAYHEESKEKLKERAVEIEELKRKMDAEAMKAVSAERKCEEQMELRRKLEEEMKVMKSKRDKLDIEREQLEENLRRAKDQSHRAERQRRELETDVPLSRDRQVDQIIHKSDNSDAASQQTIALFSMFNQLLSTVIHLFQSKPSAPDTTDKVAGEIHALTHIMTTMAAKNVQGQKNEMPALQTHYEALLNTMRADYEQRLKSLELKLCSVENAKAHSEDHAKSEMAAHFRAQIDETKRMLQEMSRKEQHLHVEQDKAHSQAVELREKVRGLERARDDALRSQKDKQNAIETLQRQLEKTTMELNENIRSHQVMVKTLQEVKFELDKERAVKQQLELKLCTHAQGHSAERQDHEARLQVMESKVDNLKRERDALVDKYKQEIATMQREHVDKIHRLTNENRDLQYDVKVAKKEIRSMEKSKDKEINSLNSELDNTIAHQKRIQQASATEIELCKDKINTLEKYKDDLCWRMTLGKMDKKMVCWVPPCPNTCANLQGGACGNQLGSSP